ncbi:lipid A biosynthesis acyltransferase [Denitratisoma sp. DHT3]|uniref:lysophospholipid acyltransferase family protein n=1 Tax=Denitratisoma sp. DHT3 TaxID=1981880 RepID=UPI00119852AE|nr:lysophospholipid acyltransferase family protein [Denitratisoma sp. DHT3]QDX82372.1 lipid A biosynthesis acyltransferase [Denitratisoma sp. DHT3]
MVFLFRLLSLLPLSWLHGMGGVAGWLAYFLVPRYRRLLRQNLMQAGLDAPGRALGAAVQAGRALLELPKLWLRPQAEVVGRVVQVSGWSLVEQAWAAGHGVLFLTPHLGCFEITAQYYASRRPMTVLYRRPKRAALAPLIERGRGANLKLAPADLSGVRTLLRALRQGEAVGMLPDQVPGSGEGVWVPFFGRPAYTMTLAARLADSGATVLLAYAERLPGGRGYHLRLFPLPAPLEGEPARKAAALNRALEDLIRQCPEQYLWGYNRYKRPRGAPPPPEAV